jgi:2Fe-2S ferredoxin
MPRIEFVLPGGGRRVVEAAEGASVMATAIAQGVDGIVGECGGNLMCATCHVHVPPPWGERLPQPSEEEEAMLEGTAAERRADSRLGCQVKVTAALDGMLVQLPARQV